MSFSEQWVITLKYDGKSSYGYAGGGAYFSSQPTIKELWGSTCQMVASFSPKGWGKLPAKRWLRCGFLNHKDYNFHHWGREGIRWTDEQEALAFKVQETKDVTYEEAMEMKKRGILRFVIKDESNPPAAAAAAETYSSFESTVRKCKNCLKEGHNASQCVSENVPFSKGGFWREYKEGYRPIPDPKGRRTYKSQFGDGKKYQLRDYPFRFGYQESELQFNERGLPYRVKEKWGKDEPYAIVEYANFGYTNEGYNAGIMKSKENAPIVLSEISRFAPLEAYSSQITEHETTTWSDLKKRLKGKSVKIGVMEYSVRTLKDAFKDLPPETILRIRLVDGGLLIITFVYGGEGWDFMLAPLGGE